MPFVESKNEVFREILSTLKSTDQSEWGIMSPQRMVEHLSDAIDLSIGRLDQNELLIPEDKVEKAIRFIHSEYPMPRDFKSLFATPEIPLREDNLEGAIAEFECKWADFIRFYTENPDHIQLHPYFGGLTSDVWLIFHSKHFSHHFEQFNLI